MRTTTRHFQLTGYRIGAALLIGAALFALSPTASSQPGTPSIASERIDAAKQAYAAVRASFDTGQATLDEVHAWSVHWLDAELAAGARKPAKKRAYAAHQARMRTLHKDVDSKFKQGMVAVKDTHKARYFKLEADVWKKSLSR